MSEQSNNEPKSYDELIEEFIQKYPLDIRIVKNYLDSIYLDDKASVEVYSLLLYNQCPKQKFQDMRQDLRKIIDKYMEIQHATQS